jgi:hypothetical protein
MFTFGQGASVPAIREVPADAPENLDVVSPDANESDIAASPALPTNPPLLPLTFPEAYEFEIDTWPPIR